MASAPIIYVAQEETLHAQPLIRALGEGDQVQVQVVPITDGDYVFYATGIRDDRPGLAGIEHKRPGDLVSCVLNTNRHLDQLRRMRGLYDEVSLLISERIIPNNEGVACVRRQGGPHPISPPYNPRETIMYARLDKHLRTLERLLGVRIIEADGYRHAAERIRNLALWWQTPPEEHRSWLGEFKVLSPMIEGERPALIRRLVSELPGIGTIRSRAVQDRAAELGVRVVDVLNWSVEEWQEVPGIGETTGRVVSEALGAKVEKRKK